MYMYDSYINIISFLITTMLYYVSLKPNPTIDTYTNKTQTHQYMYSHYFYLVVYVVLVIGVQCIVNASILSAKCGGDIDANFRTASTQTIVPWLLIFGVLAVMLVMFPGFKSVFSDIFGYYYVSHATGKLLTQLMSCEEIEQSLVTDTAMPSEKRNSLEAVSDVIGNICHNTSMVINHMVPSNFSDYWKMLTPLMKPEYQMGDNVVLRDELFHLIVTRDNIGEAMWYVYTGIVLIYIVQMNLVCQPITASV